MNTSKLATSPAAMRIPGAPWQFAKRSEMLDYLERLADKEGVAEDDSGDVPACDRRGVSRGNRRGDLAYPKRRKRSAATAVYRRTRAMNENFSLIVMCLFLLGSLAFLAQQLTSYH